MPGELFQVTHTGVASGQQFNNIAYWRTLNDEATYQSEAGLQAICDHLHGLYTTWFPPLFHESYLYLITRLREVVGKEVANPGAPAEEQYYKLSISRQKFKTPAGAIPGIATGDAMPNYVSAVCHWDTGRYGRRRRGRWKLGPWAESHNTGNQMTTTLHGNLISAAEAYRPPQAILAIPLEVRMVVFSQTSLFETESTGIPRDYSAEVENQTIPFTWGTQRTRKFGVGTS